MMPARLTPATGFDGSLEPEPLPLCAWCALPVRDGGVHTYRGGQLLQVDHYHCSQLRVEAFERARGRDRLPMEAP